MRSFTNTIWKTYQSILGIHSFDTPTLAMKILSTFFSIGIFFLIVGYFLSLTSTDMVASKQLPFIDSVPRLLEDPEFEDVKVIFPAGLWQGKRNEKCKNWNE